MCSQYDWVVTSLARFDKECILHIAGGMIRCKIQQLEVDFIGFHLARGVHLKTHIREDIQDAAQLLRGRVQSSQMDRTSGQRDVKADSSATLTRFAACPTDGRSSLESFPNSEKACISGELRPTFATRQASSAAGSLTALKLSSALFSISLILSSI